MIEAKPTPGPLVPQDREKVTSIPLKAIDCERLGMSVCFVNGHREAEAKANAILIYEAFNVHHNTGLSPVQLVEQRDELMAACKKLVEWDAREKDHAIGFMERTNLCETAFQMMYAALAKCEGVKP